MINMPAGFPAFVHQMFSLTGADMSVIPFESHAIVTDMPLFVSEPVCFMPVQLPVPHAIGDPFFLGFVPERLSLY
jgi:hypothetical protein